MWKYCYLVSILPFNFIVGLHGVFLLPNNSPFITLSPTESPVVWVELSPGPSSMGGHVTQASQSEQSILLTIVIGSGMYM